MSQGKKISKNKIFPDGWGDWESFMNDALLRSHERLKAEMGYGIPESKQLKLFGDKGEDD